MMRHEKVKEEIRAEIGGYKITNWDKFEMLKNRVMMTDFAIIMFFFGLGVVYGVVAMATSMGLL